MRYSLLFITLLLLLSNCKSDEPKVESATDSSTHSFSNYPDIRTKHLDWKAVIDFDLKQIRGIATWTFANPTSATSIQFDTYGMQIKKVMVNGKAGTFTQSPFKPEYGSALNIPVSKGDSIVSIQYVTGPMASALQWLDPSQTAGKKLPYLFTQCEPIQARSLLPCMDLPALRITYHAELQVPKGMMAVMSARNPTERNPDGRYTFDMEIPVPTYLIALAVGDISYQAIDDRSGVYTEPAMLSKASEELSDIPKMMEAAEALGGPYKWGKYDVLIAPPSFPIGGMENPRLTFATPTILAGDKSLVSLIAHEMAHSWSGNLVTNAFWSDIWLNEGYTTYFERRIMEAISGKEYTEMLWEIGYQDMQSDFNSLGMNHPDTRLKIDLKDRHPGEGFSNIPYEKGAVFLRMLEEGTGRAIFDEYLQNYFQTNAFKPMTTRQCLDYMDENLFKGNDKLRKSLMVDQWVFEPGLPSNCPHNLPLKFKTVDSIRLNFEKTGDAAAFGNNNWTTHEWLHFIRNLPHPLDQTRMTTLDKQFNLSSSGNSEIADEWYKLAIVSDYETAFPNMKSFLNSVGRKKFLEPLYGEMIKTEKGKAMAKEIFKASKTNYHPLTALKIEQLISGKK